MRPITNLHYCVIINAQQSCKSGRAFRVGLEFGPGSGLTFRKTSGFFRARHNAFKKTKLLCYFIFILCTLT